MPVPTRIGDPSTIKHVFLIVKENRTYDQVFGDIAAGQRRPGADPVRRDRHPEQARAGHAVRPLRQLLRHRHQLRRGPQLADAGRQPGVHRVAAGQYLRSYDTEDDALGHQESGFLWTGAEAAGKTVRDYGEFQQFLTKPAGATWQNLYCDALTHGLDRRSRRPTRRTSTSPIPSLNASTDSVFPKFDTSVPDIYRYEIWKQDFEKNGPANLNMFWLSSDHTGGPPSPAAQVADNDLALGKIVDDHLAQQVLAAVGDLRGRGRLAGRRGPRRRPPRPDPGHQPLGAARRRRQHLLLAGQHGPDHRADPRDRTR